MKVKKYIAPEIKERRLVLQAVLCGSPQIEIPGEGEDENPFGSPRGVFDGNN